MMSRSKESLTIREKQEEMEMRNLHPRASFSSKSRGRREKIMPCPVRTEYQRDRDRIIHSKSFRRLKGKTQVFFSAAGDHFRTRLTHTLEVSQIARTISRGLGLNEDLTEAIALGHDLGHTPFGHTGEEVLASRLSEGFHHAKQSLRVVDFLENDGRGLNLCEETRDGILNHTKGEGPIFLERSGAFPFTLEGEVVRISDVIAYVNHDIDDAIRAGILKTSDLPEGTFDILGETHSERIGSLVRAVLKATDLDNQNHITMEEKSFQAMERLRSFLYSFVYVHPHVRKELDKAQRLLNFLWDYFVSNKERLPQIFPDNFERGKLPSLQEIVDFIAGMTDAYAVEVYERLFIPKKWYIF